MSALSLSIKTTQNDSMLKLSVKSVTTRKTMSKLFIILSLCFYFYFAPIPKTCSNNETDFHALVAFKKAIHDDPMGALNSWNETVHFCAWKGVVCGRRHPDRVVAIDLASSSLVGTISPHLGNLSFLQNITLQNNTFHGQIPDEIGNLGRLKWVGLRNNSLSGEIPRNISRCSNIRHLDFFNNKFTETIPLDLSSWVKIEYLVLGRNQISGTIPPLIGNFTRLVSLSLEHCRFRGEIPESFAQLRSLEFIDLSWNNLTGRVPFGLYNISTLSLLDISHNHLEGTTPTHVDFIFSSLKWIAFASNHFTGEIPVSFSNLSSLVYLGLGSNSFTGPVKMEFSRMPSLEYLQLYRNNFEGDIDFISSMKNCTNLKRLELNHNMFSGLLPLSIANLSSHMSYLVLSNNKLRGKIPSDIGNLVGLTTFGLDYNDLSGPIPYEIGKLNNVQKLRVDNNRLTNDIPFSLGNLTMLNILVLSQNSLSGTIPISISNCTDLEWFDVSDNNLTGLVPGAIMSSPSKSYFMNLSHNAFTGPIPSEVGSLVNLVSLDLSHNRFSRNIPISLSNCILLVELYLESNSLHGEIPDALSTLRGVQYLDLSENNLSGVIPSFLGGLSLMHLNLSFNNLEGEVPTSGVFLNSSIISLEGNSRLCGGIPSLSFSLCLTKNSEKKHFHTVFKILISVVATGAILLACYFVFMCRRKSSKDGQSSMVPLEAEYMRLSYGDLQKSTDGFSESNLLGAGRFGSVYKGVLQDMQTFLAVKVLNLHVKGASKSFMSECSALRGIRHRNLVKIVSACSSTDFQGNEFKALIYEFLANGNLDEWLHHQSDDESKSLSLRQRLNISIDVASAIDYLHFGTGSTIVHGDLKPSNILLDEDMIAHVGDFGLAKIISSLLSTHENSSAGIRGTLGYIPPEYGMSGMVSTEGDVYGFGILLLELFTGIRPTHDDFGESSSLRDFVRSALPDQVMEIVDPIIQQEYYNGRMNEKILKCVLSLLEMGLACSNELPRERMVMPAVVNELHKIVSMA